MLVQKDILRSIADKVNTLKRKKYKRKKGVSLFIGLRGINGTLTAFLGLLTDFKRKLDLAVVAIPPKAGMRMR